MTPKRPVVRSFGRFGCYNVTSRGQDVLRIAARSPIVGAAVRSMVANGLDGTDAIFSAVMTTVAKRYGVTIASPPTAIDR